MQARQQLLTQAVAPEGGVPPSPPPTPGTVCSMSAVCAPVRHVQFAGAAGGLLGTGVKVDSCWTFSSSTDINKVNKDLTVATFT